MRRIFEYCVVDSRVAAVGIAFLFGVMFSNADAQQQMVNNQVRFNNINDSFSERIGMGFGINSAPGAQVPFQLNVGGQARAAPQFGNFRQGAGVTAGIGFNGGFGAFNGFGGASQGSTRSNVSQTLSLTTMNGQVGTIMDTSQSPFVISVVPVVGNSPFTNYGAANSIAGRLLRGEIHIDSEGKLQDGPNREIPRVHPDQPRALMVPKREAAAERARIAAEQNQALVRERFEIPAKKPGPEKVLHIGNDQADAELSAQPSLGGNSSAVSSADTPTISLAEIEQQKNELIAKQQVEAQKYLTKAEAAAADGKDNVAKIYYRMAAKRATGELKVEILEKLNQE